MLHYFQVFGTCIIDFIDVLYSKNKGVPDCYILSKNHVLMGLLYSKNVNLIIGFCNFQPSLKSTIGTCIDTYDKIWCRLSFMNFILVCVGNQLYHWD